MKMKGKLLLIAVVLCIISAIECDKIRIRARLLNRNNRLVNLNRSLKKRGVFHNHAGLLLAPQHKIYGYTPLAAPIGNAHLPITHAHHSAKFTLPHVHAPKFHHHVDTQHAALPAVNVPQFHQHVDVPSAVLPSVNVPQFHHHVEAPVANNPQLHHHVDVPLVPEPSGPHVHPVVEAPLSAPIFPTLQRVPVAPVGPTVATLIPQHHHHASVYGTSGGVINGHPFILRPGNAVVQSYNVNYPRPVVHAHVPAPVPVPQAPVQFAHTPVSAVASGPIHPGTVFPGPGVVQISGHHNYFVPRPAAVPVFPSPSPAPVLPVFPGTAVFPSARPFIPSPAVPPQPPVFASPAPQPPVFASPVPQPPVFQSPVPQHPFFFDQGLPEPTPTVLSERPIVVPEPQQPEQPSQFPQLPQFPSGGSDILPGQIPPQGGSDILPGQIPAQPPFQGVPQQPWTPSVFNPAPEFPSNPQQPPVLPPVHGNVEPGYHGPSGYHYPNPNHKKR